MGEITIVQLIFALAVVTSCVIAPFLLFLFLRYRQEGKAEETRMSTMRDMGRSCHDFQVESSRLQREAFSRVVAALDENSKALNVNNEILRRWRPPEDQHKVRT